LRGPLHPVFAQLVKIRRQPDLDGLIHAGRDVVQPHIRAQLIDDLTLGKRCTLTVPSCVPRELLQPLAVLIHRPEIHSPVAVTQKVQTAVPCHCVLACARIVTSEAHRLTPRSVLPDALCGSALIPLRLASLEWHASKEHRLPVASESTLCRL